MTKNTRFSSISSRICYFPTPIFCTMRISTPGVRCRVLQISNMPLTPRANRSLVTALTRGVQVVKLGHRAPADLDMETLAQYDCRVACRSRPVSGV